MKFAIGPTGIRAVCSVGLPIANIVLVPDADAGRPSIAQTPDSVGARLNRRLPPADPAGRGSGRPGIRTAWRTMAKRMVKKMDRSAQKRDKKG